MKFKIDNLQYCNWSRKIFEINREAGLDAVHVTIVYHEDFDEHLNEIQKWKKLFEENSDLIFLGNNFKDIEKANKEKKTAIFFGFQNCSPIEDDINLVEKVHELGCRFMQLTYNNQSLLATGCYEKIDSGVTNFGREVIKEMNRVGVVIDMSHSAEKSTFDAIEISEKQIAITHEVGDLGDQYNSFLDVEEVSNNEMNHGDVLINQNGKLVRPKRLPSNLYRFKDGTGEARCILDSITSLQNGADLIWIETEKPHIGQIAGMMKEIRKTIPNAKLVYNNSPSFNWTLNFRQQVYDVWESEGKDLSNYELINKMENFDSSKYFELILNA